MKKIDALLAEAEFTVRFEMFDLAVKTVNKILALDPDNTQALYMMGRALVGKSDYGKAEPYFDKVLELDKDFTAAIAGKGFALLGNGETKRAARYFDLYLKTDPDDTDVLYGKATTLAAAGEYRDALKYLDLVLQQTPDHHMAILHKGEVLLFLEEHEKARACFKEVLEIDRGNDDAHMYLDQLEHTHPSPARKWEHKQLRSVEKLKRRK